jgi:diguanylate cyclase (GGDEF)-like protein
MGASAGGVGTSGWRHSRAARRIPYLSYAIGGCPVLQSIPLDEIQRETPTMLLARLRRRLIAALGVLFVAALLVAGPLSGEAELSGLLGPTVILLARLAVLAVLLPLAMVALARAILEPAEDLARTNDRLRTMYDTARLDSLIDPLTGLGNHRAFQEEFRRQIEDARRRDTPLALVLIDLDDLKLVNDQAGHAGGDDLLEATGRLLASATRSADRAFRVGGDEFAVLLPGTDADTALVITRRLLVRALEPESRPPHDRPISFSAGVSAFPELGRQASHIYRQADAALYSVKHHGRTGVEIFDPERHGASDDERTTPELAAAVARVAKAHALRPVYQPIFSLQTGDPIAFEGLVRPSEDAGFATPDALFVAAEAAGRTTELDLACLDVILARAFLASGQYLSVNLSPRTIESDEFSAAELVRRFERAGFDPGQVVLELTEREAAEDIERLRSNLEACRAHGMRVAVDDVGAGNAGLQLLSQMRFDIVKIDLSLVQRGVLRESALGVLRAIGELARRWDATIVAEGVETPEQLETVRGLGFAAAQGYLLGRPDDEATAEPIDLGSFMARQAWVVGEEAEPPVAELQGTAFA